VVDIYTWGSAFLAYRYDAEQRLASPVGFDTATANLVSFGLFWLGLQSRCSSDVKDVIGIRDSVEVTALPFVSSTFDPALMVRIIKPCRDKAREWVSTPWPGDRTCEAGPDVGVTSVSVSEESDLVLCKQHTKSRRDDEIVRLGPCGRDVRFIFDG
jgi:hypothetical protein